MKKILYIAAPFFTPQQVETVRSVEHAIEECGLGFYSPRLDGILKDMLPEERKAKSKEVFRRNCAKLIDCDAILAILDDKDTGTTWECGFGYYHSRYFSPGYRVLAYTTEERELNVMLAKSFAAHAKGLPQLKALLRAYRDNNPLLAPEPTDKVY